MVGTIVKLNMFTRFLSRSTLSLSKCSFLNHVVIVFFYLTICTKLLFENKRHTNKN